MLDELFQLFGKLFELFELFCELFELFELFGKLFELFEYISVHFGSKKCPPQSGALSGRKCTPHFRFEPPQPPTQGPWGVPRGQEEPRPLALVPGSPGPRLGTQGALGLPEKAQARGA